MRCCTGSGARSPARSLNPRRPRRDIEEIGMAIDMTPEQRTRGETNFKSAVEHLGLDRRGFLKAGIVGAGAVGGSAAAIYFGYQSLQGKPVRTALIGSGDEGGVLVGEHN